MAKIATADEPAMTVTDRPSGFSPTGRWNMVNVRHVVTRVVRRITVAILRRLFRHLLLLEDYIVCMRRCTVVPRTVAVVRMDAIGDFVIWLDAASALLSLYPRPYYRRTLIANDVWADLAESIGLFDDVIPLNREKLVTSPRYRWTALCAVRKQGFEVAIHPTYSRDFLYSDAIVWTSGAVKRIGYSGDLANMRPWEQRVSNRWYTRLVGASAQPQMELERNANFVRSLGCADFKAGVPQLTVTQTLPVDIAGKDYFVIFPGASWAGKRWPARNFIEIVRRIQGATGWMTVVCGGPEDSEYNHALCRDLDVPLQNWTGRTSLVELSAIIGQARVLVSNDTSAVHIAAATGRPAVCIVGGGHYGRFLPYETEVTPETPLPRAVTHKMDCFNCNWRCIYRVPKYQAVPCVAKVSVEDVWQAVVPFVTAMKTGIH